MNTPQQHASASTGDPSDATEHGLSHWRAQIDALDVQLLDLLAQRRRAVQEIGKIKRAEGLDPLDEQRWQAVLEARLHHARQLNLSPTFIQALYELIHQYSLDLESQPPERDATP